MCSVIIVMAVLSAADVTITQPADGGVYDGDWLTLNALVENWGLLPDSVTFSLNGEPFVPVPRLCTDWHTYMQNDLHNGFLESLHSGSATFLPNTSPGPCIDTGVRPVGKTAAMPFGAGNHPGAAFRDMDPRRLSAFGVLSDKAGVGRRNGH
ncbi:MAG: hypothetical protein R6V62_05245 [Candidatus Fermentibacteraceae bacterium]